jgi:hypothetical protein
MPHSTMVGIVPHLRNDLTSELVDLFHLTVDHHLGCPSAFLVLLEGFLVVVQRITHGKDLLLILELDC